MFDFIVYVTLALTPPNTEEVVYKEFATMEECTFEAGAYIGGLMESDDMKGIGSSWNDFDQDGTYEAIIWEVEELSTGSRASIVCVLRGSAELL